MSGTMRRVTLAYRRSSATGCGLLLTERHHSLIAPRIRLGMGWFGYRIDAKIAIEQFRPRQAKTTPLGESNTMNTLLPRAFTAFLAATFCLCFSPVLLAQDASYKPKDQKLYDTIERLDAELFDAFNRQDLESLMKFFSEDIEFFDDGEGLTNYKQNIESFKGLFARNKTSKLRR